MATGKNEWDKANPDEMTDQKALTAAVKRFGIRLYGEGCSSYPPIEGEDYHTWAVGRLIEEMGERFRGLNKTLSGRFCVNVSGPGSRSSKRTEYYPTPLQALIAAQTAILENTLEAIGDPVRDSNLRNRAIAIELKALGRGKGGKP